MRGIFVTGTDTGVGKTVLCAALMIRYPGARYWKPIQTGPDDDTAEVLRLSESSRDAAYLHGVRLPDPVSPHLAAQRAGVRINLEAHAAAPKESDAAWTVEGAGGALVPVNESDLMVHLMERLGLPAVIATRTTLGTINHTLLTIEALRARLGHGRGSGDDRRSRSRQSTRHRALWERAGARRNAAIRTVRRRVFAEVGRRIARSRKPLAGVPAMSLAQ